MRNDTCYDLLPDKTDTVAVALSGGVDSAVAAAILREQGYSLIGITMQLLPDSVPDDRAERVADHLGIPLHRIDLCDAFSSQIITPFANSYLNGETPNPCVRCNRLFKFGLLLEHAKSLGAGWLATGHYARVISDAGGAARLYAAEDRRKDQSYFLATIGQQALERAVFPLGGMHGKDEVREKARYYNLPVAESAESQDVCFLPESGYGKLLESRLSGSRIPRGLIVHKNGQILGRHNGFWRYTVGQRKGLGIAWKEPLYVTEINAARNRIVVGEEPHLYSGGLVADSSVWLVPPPAGIFEAQCKIRYRHSPVGCRVAVAGSETFRVQFDEPQRAVTPGQTVVVYDNGMVLGAGRIEMAEQGFENDAES